MNLWRRKETNPKRFVIKKNLKRFDEGDDDEFWME